MKYLYTIAFILFVFNLKSYTQSDGCSAATSIPVTANCSSPVSGTTIGATQTITGCVGTADDDVWYTFTATATSHMITVVPSASMDPVVQLFSGPCSSLISINCMDQGATGDAETIYANGLTIGNVYTIRVYHYFAGSGSGTFTICVTTAPTPPSNDNCSNATLLTVNTSCTYTNATTLGATESQTGCTGTADDDVWFKFVATNSVQTITVDPSISMDPVMELFSGSCGTLTSIECMDNGFTDGNEVISAVGLIPGNTYYIRVYDYYSNTGGAPFQICIVGAATPTPSNDEPCNAIALPAVTSLCNFLNFTTTGATTSAGAPIPASCAGGSAPQQGGFNNTPQPKDVWFSITVPANGIISITAQPSYGISDGVMALYSGICSSLSQIACSDDYNYPGTTNDYKPFILSSGLTPGSTVYLRYWAFNGNTTGNFGICVSTPENDDCGSSLYICDLNGYTGTTNAAYTVDRPCNMRANAEMDNSPLYTYTPGTCQGGIFGLGGTWGTGAPACDVRIDNNSWIRFTASNTTATLNVNIYNCYVGNYPSGGIQMQMFSSNGSCCNFTPVSDFKEGSSLITITANNLTIGNDYYLMIDGFAGDICSYSITASAGVQFTDITTASSSICIGETIVLHGPDGASSYLWSPGGQTTQDITVTPAYSQTYSLEVAGVCGDRQTLDIQITVNNPPTASISPATSTICTGQSATLTASGGASYAWSNGGNTAVITVSPVTTTTYTVTVTSAAGCTSTTTRTVTVNSLPAASISPATATICAGQSTTLTASGGTSYAWSNGGNTAAITVSPATTTTYTVTVTNAAGCTATTTRTVTVNTLPTASISPATSTICVGQSATLTASGGTSYAWSTGGNTAAVTVSPATTTIYTVTVTNAAGCTATTTRTVTVNSLPTASISPATTTICTGQNATLTASGGTNYAWSTGGNTAAITVSPSSNTNYTVTVTNSSGCSSSTTCTVNVNFLPTAAISPATATICAGQSTTLTASGGTSYAWSSGDNTASATVSPATTTTYTVTVTNAAGCTATTTRTVTVNSLPTASISPATATICAGQSTTLTASGGTNYAWSNGNNTASTAVSPAATTTYTVTVTNASGCTAISTITVTVNTLPVANAGTNVSIPNGTSTTLSGSASGGSGNYSYLWSPSGLLVNASIQNPQTTNLSSTTVYTVTVTDVNTGCTSTAQVTVTVTGGPLTLNLTSNNASICEGQSTQLNSIVSGGTGNYTYNWSSNPGTFSSTDANPTVSPNTTTTYYVTVNDGFNSSSNNITVTVNSNPSATAVNTGPYCEDDTIDLNSTGGNSYNWSGPSSYSSTNQNSIINNATLSMGGTYTVTVTDNNNCTSTATTQVIIYQNPVSVSSNTGPYCTGETIQLNSSGGNNYNWSGPSGWSSNLQDPTYPNATSSMNGTYYVTITNSDGCSSVASTMVTVNNNPILDAGNNISITYGTNTSFNASVTGGSGNYTFVWSPDSLLLNSNIQNPTTVNLTSNVIFYVTVTDVTTGCTSTDNISVTMSGNPLIVAPSASQNIICEGNTITLSANASGGTSNYTYTWTSNPSGFSSGSSSPVDSPQVSTIYYVTVNDGFNNAYDTISVVVNPTPTANASNTGDYCEDENIELIASGGTDYLWSGPLNYTSSTQNPQITNAVINMSGLYSVTVTNAYSCSDTATTTVNVYLKPIVTLNNTGPYCNGDTIRLSVSTAETYSWSGPNGFISNVQNPEIINSETNNSGTYTVVISNSNNCTNSGQINISYPSEIIVTGTVSIEQINHLGNIDLSISGGTNPYSFIWSNGNQTEDISNLISGNYTVTVTDAEDCYIISDFNIDIPLLIPSVITPNNDGKNDDFEITNIQAYNSVKIEIFNRWGDRIFIFDGSGYQYFNKSERWDGKFNGKDLPMGSYMYIIKLNNLDPITGVCSIIR